MIRLMKKIFVPLAVMAVMALAFTGCAGEEDDIFDKTASIRQLHTDRNFLPADHETGEIYACPQIRG